MSCAWAEMLRLCVRRWPRWPGRTTSTQALFDYGSKPGDALDGPIARIVRSVLMWTL